MALEVGAILEGKVTGITKFGVFVALPEGKSGLVHISEVANAFVSDINEHVQMGQTVKVRVLNITDDGKINLSIKRAQDMPQRQNYSERPQRPRTAHTERQPELLSGRSLCRSRTAASRITACIPIGNSAAAEEDKLIAGTLYRRFCHYLFRSGIR